MEDASPRRGKLPNQKASRDEWRGELDQRLQAYRARRRKPDARQSALPFDAHAAPLRRPVALEECAPTELSVGEDFAFTIAIGRIAQADPSDSQVLIDVSAPPSTEAGESEWKAEQSTATDHGRLPVASLQERRSALLTDAVCLAFAYGGFLALFGSLGGHFTLSKLSAAVCVFTFAFVYVQYFALFTVFGGSTPGMMLGGLQVSSATGDVPTPRQYFLRAAGYILSAGTCFMGFLWVFWDEEELTWHDRISQTYLTNVERFAEEEATHGATVR